MTRVATREVAAHLLASLGAGSGRVSLADVAAGVPPDDLDEALTVLSSRGLAELGSDGVLRAGPRGSLLAAEDIRRSLRTERLGRRIDVRASVESTNDVAMRRSVNGDGDGLVVAAELQRGGRGRHGRVFDSAPGLGVWSTTVLPPPRDAGSSSRLSLIVALAVCAAIEDTTGWTAGLKWPNDVRINGRKVCGVLVEARSAGRSLHVIAGVGLNVHHTRDDFPPGLRDLAGSLESETGSRVERGGALAAILNRLEPALDEERAGRFDLPARFGRHDDLRDREVRLDAPEGRLEGTARGIDEAGRLRLEVPGRGVVSLRSAEVTVAAGGR